MKDFLSPFKTELEEFLNIRERSVAPATFKNDIRWLYSFDCYLGQCGCTERIVSENAVSGWIQQIQSERDISLKTVADGLGYLRNFLRYLQYCGVPVFIPTNPRCPEEYIPYLFSDEEIERIFHVADSLYAGSDFARAEFPMILRMLYGCGFRIGELLSVRVRDVDFRRATVLLRNTKNKKQRLVPMSNSLALMLEKYCMALGLSARPDSYLFPGRQHGKAISAKTVYSRFITVLKTAGIYFQPESHKRGQCLHCFRHVFAVRSFAKAERSGHSPESSVPYLSVYLGHFDMDGTEKYLKFSGDMFPEYADLFESYARNVFSEVLYEE